jgi:hypothetical protein
LHHLEGDTQGTHEQQATYARSARRIKQVTRIANHASADNTMGVDHIVVATTIAINVKVHKAPTNIDRDAETAAIATINWTAATAMVAGNAGRYATATVAAQCQQKSRGRGMTIVKATKRVRWINATTVIDAMNTIDVKKQGSPPW